MPKYEDGQIYHLYNHGAHRYQIFRKAAHYRRCLKLLTHYATKYRVTVLAYCLMPNHYHILAKQEEGGSISRFLQTTFNAYVQYFNLLERHSGTLFQGAAKFRLIDTDDYLVRIICYIHSNPVWGSLVTNAGMWEYSDYLTWTSTSGERFAGRTLRDELFGNGRIYQRTVESYKPQATEEPRNPRVRRRLSTRTAVLRPRTP